MGNKVQTNRQVSENDNMSKSNNSVLSKSNHVKIGQGQLRLIIYTYFVLPYMGMVAILVK